MNSLMLRITAICFVVLFVTVDVAAQREASKAPRILVDASKCGGLWWFPQGGAFDPKQYHQGKAFADSMRLRGWQVEEIPRGEVITVGRLRDADIVIRPPAYFPYSVEEIAAYHQSVMAGTRLLLVGGATDDVVAQYFGVRFEPRSRFAAVRKWIPHPFTENIGVANVAWTPIVEAPAGAVVLAWLSRQAETNPRPVLGYLPYGRGYVVFMSQPLISPGLASAFPSSLVNYMVRYTPEEARRLPLGLPVFARESIGQAPNLLEPLAGATLPQPEAAEWRFDWDDVPGAKSYEIVVLGPAAMFPLFHASTTRSEYAAPVKPGYVADFNLEGWSWRVRAHYSDVAFGPWSPARRFNVTRR